MKKNIAIAVLALLCIAFFFYGLIQHIEAKKQAETAFELAKKVREHQATAEENFRRAEELFQRTRKMADEAIAREAEAQKLRTKK
jgi:predicted Holliday junction resolvase-like endonuclease